MSFSVRGYPPSWYAGSFWRYTGSEGALRALPVPVVETTAVGEALHGVARYGHALYAR